MKPVQTSTLALAIVVIVLITLPIFRSSDTSYLNHSISNCPLESQLTGEQSLSWSNFSASEWVATNVSIDPTTHAAFLGHYERNTTTTAFNYSTSYIVDIITSYSKTWYDDGSTWHCWSDWDMKTVRLDLYFQNPDPAREY